MTALVLSLVIGECVDCEQMTRAGHMGRQHVCKQGCLTGRQRSRVGPSTSELSVITDQKEHYTGQATFIIPHTRWLYIILYEGEKKNKSSPLI